MALDGRPRKGPVMTMVLLGYLLLLPALCYAARVRVEDHWIRVKLELELQKSVEGGWQMQLELDTPAEDIRVWRMEVRRNESDSQRWILKNVAYNTDLKKGKHSFKVQLKFTGLQSPSCVRAWLVGVEEVSPCLSAQMSGSITPATTNPRPAVTDDPRSSNTRSPVDAGPHTTRRTPLTTTRSWFPCNTSPRPARVTTAPDGVARVNLTGMIPYPDGERYFAIPVRIRFRRPRMFGGVIHTTLPTSMHGWAIKLVFSSPVQRIRSHRADVHATANRTVYFLTSKSFNRHVAAGNVLRVKFFGYTRFSVPPYYAFAVLARDIADFFLTTNSSDEVPTPTPTPTPKLTLTPKPRVVGTVRPEQVELHTPPSVRTITKTPETIATPSTLASSDSYNYEDVLQGSISFYKTQCSGKRTVWNHAPMRQDSALAHAGGDKMEDTKRLAAATATLLWGILEYREAYVTAGGLQTVLDSVRCLLNDLMDDLPDHLTASGKRGRGSSTEAPPGGGSQTLSRTTPPSVDVTADVAAAMAAGATIFGSIDRRYSRKLLKHARTLYNLAYNTRLYDHRPSVAIPGEQVQNGTNVDADALGWAATWLYLHTREERYLMHAIFGIPKRPLKEYSWEDKSPGYMVLLYRVREDPAVRLMVEEFLDYWMTLVPRTPDGLAWYKQPGVNSYAANAAFVALNAAKLGIRVSEGRQFARRQIHAMLGDAGHSYVVGFGHDPPQHPTYGAAFRSCPDGAESCVEEFDDPPVGELDDLKGALVSGPDLSGLWQDVQNRPDWTGVRLDYNAGFQGAVAGLRYLELE